MGFAGDEEDAKVLADAVEFDNGGVVDVGEFVLKPSGY